MRSVKVVALLVSTGAFLALHLAPAWADTQSSASDVGLPSMTNVIIAATGLLVGGVLVVAASYRRGE